MLNNSIQPQRPRIRVISASSLRGKPMFKPSSTDRPVKRETDNSQSVHRADERRTTAKRRISKISNNSGQASHQLLSDIYKIFRAKKAHVLRTRDIIAALCLDKEKPWATYNRGSNIVPKQISLLLNDIKSHGFWSEGVSAKGYSFELIKKAYRRLRKDK